MIRLLFKYIVPLALFLVIGIVGYNYFYGTPEEQESSKQIISKIKGLGADVFQLLASEKDKFDAGKYDQAIDKISESINYLKQAAGELAGAGQQYLDEIKQLEQEKQYLENQLQSLSASQEIVGEGRSALMATHQGAATVESIQNRLNELAKRTEQLGSRIHKP